MIKLETCQFLRRTMTYLGYELSEEGLLPGTRKIKAIHDFPRPTTVTEIKRFHGLCSYFRKFIPHFSTIASSLMKLTRKDVPWDWGEKQEWAFQKLKEKLMSAEVLIYPDPTKPFYLWTDASGTGLGACLMQEDQKLPKKPL